MTRICFVFITVAVFIQTVAGQSEETDWLQHVIPNKERSFDFKTVAKGAIPEYQFVLKNPLQEPIHIVSVTPSCTCTTVVFDREKTVLQTYEKFEIAVKLQGDAFEGQRNSTLTVVIDQPNRAEIQLNIRGEIRSDLKISPADFIDFGNVAPEKGASRTLTVSYTGSNTQWRIVDVRCDNEFIHADIANDFSNIGQRKFNITVSLDKSAPNGNLRTLLFLITNDGATRREIPISIKATVGTVINVTPSPLFFGALPPGKPSPQKNVVLRGTMPFRILKIECDNPAVEISWTMDAQASPKGMHLIPISYRNPIEGEGAPKDDGTMLAVIRVTTDIPGVSPEFYATMSVQKKESEE